MKKDDIKVSTHVKISDDYDENSLSALEDVLTDENLKARFKKYTKDFSVSGGVSLNINGTQILSKEDVGNLEFLYGYLYDILKRYHAKEQVEPYFLDSDKLLVFEHDKDPKNMIIKVAEVDTYDFDKINETTVNCDRDELSVALLGEIENFYSDVQKIKGTSKHHHDILNVRAMKRKLLFRKKEKLKETGVFSR